MLQGIWRDSWQYDLRKAFDIIQQYKQGGLCLILLTGYPDKFYRAISWYILQIFFATRIFKCIFFLGANHLHELICQLLRHSLSHGCNALHIFYFCSFSVEFSFLLKDRFLFIIQIVLFFLSVLFLYVYSFAWFVC